MNEAILFIDYLRFTITLLLGVIGNAFVIYVVGYLKNKRKSEDIYVLSLASADILTSLLSAAEFLIYNFAIEHGFNGFKYFLFAVTSIYRVIICASAWLLVCISVNRYR